ncbi:MAG: hypothetical protein L3K09_05605, partial [Thermoplasmata archaeon]|nr:hypothetical protein [Thermoplasmata archaeon]
YSRNPPVGGPSAASRRSAARGTEFHDRYLFREERRDRRLPAFALLLLTGLALLALGAWLWVRP